MYNLCLLYTFWFCFLALLNVSTNVTKPVEFNDKSSVIHWVTSSKYLNFFWQFFWLRTLSWWNLIRNYWLGSKPATFIHFRCLGVWLIYSLWHVKLRHLIAKGFGKNGDSLKFILWPLGKSTVIESKGFTVIQSAQIWVIQSVVLYE